MTPEQEIAVANEAQAVLKNRLFRDIIDDEKAKWVYAWINSRVADMDAREACWRHYKAAEALEARFKSLVDTGKMARMQKEKNAQFEGGSLE